MFEDLKLTIHWTESAELINKLNLKEENQVFVGEDAYLAWATLNYTDKKLFNDNFFEYKGYAKTKVSLDYKGNHLIAGGRIDLSDLEFGNEKSPFICLADESSSDEERTLVEELLTEEAKYLKTHDLSELNGYKAWPYQYEMDRQLFEKYEINAKYPKSEIMSWRKDKTSGNVIFTSFYNIRDLKKYIDRAGVSPEIKLRPPEGLPVEAAMEKLKSLAIQDTLQDGRGCWCKRADYNKGLQAFKELIIVHDKFLKWAKTVADDIFFASNMGPDKIVDISISDFITEKMTLRLGKNQGYTTLQYLGEGLQGTCLFTDEELLAIAWHMSATQNWDHPELPLRKQSVINPQLVEQICGEILAFMDTPQYREFYKRTQRIMEDEMSRNISREYRDFMNSRKAASPSREIKETIASTSFDELNQEKYIFQVKSSTGEPVKFTTIPKEDLVTDVLVYIKMLNHGHSKEKIRNVFKERSPMAAFFENYDEIAAKAATTVIKKFPELVKVSKPAKNPQNHPAR